jgi:anti-sigma factor ChrR (cupin superfamily)
MRDAGGKTGCLQIELAGAFAIGALPPEEQPTVQAHIADCRVCQEEVASLRGVINALPCWPPDMLRVPSSLWERLADRVTDESGTSPLAAIAPPDEPAWARVATGIYCKLLALDTTSDRVSMLVRLDPGAEYPPHVHADTEELYLLDGELWIDDRRLVPGDCSRAEPRTADRRVWSQTGCTCVLITSTRDRLID